MIITGIFISRGSTPCLTLTFCWCSLHRLYLPVTVLLPATFMLPRCSALRHCTINHGCGSLTRCAATCCCRTSRPGAAHVFVSPRTARRWSPVPRPGLRGVRCDAAAPACHYCSRSSTSSIVCCSCPSLSLYFFERVLHSLSVRLIHDKSQLGPHTRSTGDTRPFRLLFVLCIFVCLSDVRHHPLSARSYFIVVSFTPSTRHIDLSSTPLLFTSPCGVIV